MKVDLTTTLTIQADSLGEALAFAPALIDDLNAYLGDPYVISLGASERVPRVPGTDFGGEG